MFHPRRHERIACELPVVAQGPRGGVRGRCVDLSLSGAFLSGVPLNPGASTSVRFDLGAAGTLEVQAIVRNHTAKGCGIEFVRLEQKHMATLEDIIEGLKGAALLAG